MSIGERKSSFIFDCDQKTFPCNVFWFRTVFAADKIFIGLFSSFRLGRKESQMEIVPDHLCHFQSKSLSAFLGNVRNQICFPGPRSPWLLLTPYLLLCLALISFGDNKFHMEEGRRQSKIAKYSKELLTLTHPQFMAISYPNHH